MGKIICEETRSLCWKTHTTYLVVIATNETSNGLSTILEVVNIGVLVAKSIIVPLETVLRY